MFATQPTFQVATYEEADNAIDSRLREIRRLEREVSDIRKSRNALSTVNKLPTETLSMIFLALAASCAETKKENDMNPRCYDWLAVTLVCARWNEVALGTPRLWADLYFPARSGPRGFQKQVQLFFDRSGGVPLRIFQQGNHSMGEESPEEPARPLPLKFLEMLMKESHRFHELSLVVDEQEFVHIPSSKLASPTLHTLAISAITDDFPIHDTTFDPLGQTSWPNLRVLRCCWTSWGLLKALIRPSLTSLDVNCITHPRAMQSLTDWLTLLGNLPCLASLRLSTDAFDFNPVRLAPLRLPKLNDVYLSERHVGVYSAKLLDKIILPATARITFEARYDAPWTANSVLGWLSRKALGDNIEGLPVPATHLTVSLPQFGDLGALEINISSKDTHSPCTGAEFIIRLKMAMRRSTAHIEPLLTRILTEHPLSEVTAISLQAIWQDSVASDSWRLMSNLPAVQGLSLSFQKTNELPSALRQLLQGRLDLYPPSDAHLKGEEKDEGDDSGAAPEASDAQGGRRFTAAFPKLERLHLHGLLHEPANDQFTLQLAEIACARRNMGVPLKYLGLTGCQVAHPCLDDDHVMRVTEAVDKVFWEGCVSLRVAQRLVGQRQQSP